MHNKIILAILALLCAATGRAEIANSDSSVSRPVTSTYSISTGHKNVLATYLSPLHYSGADFSMSGSWTKAMPFSPRSAIMHFNADLNFSNLENPAHTARMIGLTAAFSWGMSWRKTLPLNIQITAGGTIGMEGGAYYLLRNGNNPVEAIANLSLGLRASASRPFKIGKLDVLVSDIVNLPSTSIFFSPEYGETYYEIYLGNHSGLAHAGWWGNNFRINNLLSATLDFGRTSLSLGYRFNAYNQWACHLNTKIISHAFVIGVVPGGIGLKKKAREIPTETIYSTF